MDKSPDAFRTISEVADLLETPAHVLRFWESRFPQIRPVKRAGGRRYYRPADVALLTGIKRLLHDEGLTIRGVQKILREQGVRHVAGLSGALYPDDSDIDAETALEEALALNFGDLDPEPTIAPEQAASATVVALETALRRQDQAPPATSGVVQPLWPAAPDATPAAASTRLVPDEEAPFIEVEEEDAEAPATLRAPIARDAVLPDTSPYPHHPESRQPAEGAKLLDRLRALPAAALAGSPAAALLHDRLQALHQRLLAAPDQATASR
jgi:DNA-binding transcriptional MerR regulator